MTSWTRGKKNENKGESMMDKPGLADKAKGAALKVAGAVEQGVDNVKDKVTGRQKTLKGTSPKPAARKKRSTGTKQD
jgi:uncharacterized protein YjbJ (UPF0337 family)